MTKLVEFICSRPECDETGKRYQSQIRNPDRLYCSRKCKGLDETRFVQGEDNPNFKHGRYVNPTCDCGNVKDERSEQCYECAGRSYAVGKRKSLDERFVVGEKRDGYLRKLVLKNNLIPYVCFGCNNKGTWRGQELVLELDHINGDPKDSRLENLRFACPNCHTQTPTYGSRNKLWHNQRKR